jgi:hypothetical protein
MRAKIEHANGDDRAVIEDLVRGLSHRLALDHSVLPTAAKAGH